MEELTPKAVHAISIWTIDALQKDLCNVDQSTAFILANAETKAPVTAEDGLQAIRVLEAAQELIVTGEPQTLN